MPTVLLPFFSGLISETPADLAPNTQYWVNHIIGTLTDDSTIPASVVIDRIRIRTCVGRFQTARTLPLDFAPLMVPPATTPPLGLGWSAMSGAPYFETSAGHEGIVCAESWLLYPARDIGTTTADPTINPATSLPYTRAELFSYEFGWQIGSANLSPFFSVTVEELRITEGSVEVTYVEAAKTGSLAFGVSTTVTAAQAIAFGVDGNVNVHATSGMVRIFGDLAVSGASGGGASISAVLDGLGT